MTIGVGVETSGGRYVLLEPIGQGGMGEVYKARDRQLDRIVAIKVVRPDSSLGEAVTKRLEREARLAASLDHPFICKIHELVPHGDGQSLLVLEYIDGRTLKDMLREGPIDPARVLRYGREMAEALAVAHKSNLIHRDIKPSNVMVTSHGHIKVMDFGIAKSLLPPDASTTSTLTERGRVVGTPAYMSPEQAAGRQVDARSDVFSFGVLLYECLTGTRPYAETDPEAETGDRFATPPKPLPAAIPADLRALVTRCLETRRDARFPDFNAVRAALDTSTLLRASVTSTDALPWIDRRSKRQVWLGVVGLLAAVVIAVVLLWPRPGAPATNVREQVPIVTWPTTEKDGRISADGTKVAFVSIERGASRLWIRSIDGGEPVPIGSPRAALKSPVWSPDGQEIAVLIREGDQAWIQVLKQFGAQSGAPVSLGVLWRQANLVRWLGNYVYISVLSTDSTGSTLWRHDRRDGSMRQITHEAEGKRFSLNGELVNVDVNGTESRIVFEGYGKDARRIFVADLDGRNAQMLPVQPNTVVTPRWRGPRGDRIVYIDNTNGQYDIWEYASETKTARPLTTSPLEEVALDVSPAGDIIVADTLEESGHLWLVHPDRTDAPRQLTNDSESDVWPGFVGSDRILFHRGRPRSSGMLPLDTDVFTAVWQNDRLMDPRQIATGAAGVMSPDGRYVAFVRSQKPPAAELWVIDRNSAQPAVRLDDRFWFPGTHVPTWEAVGQTAAWSPAEPRTLVYVRLTTTGGFELVRAAIDENLAGRSTVLLLEPPVKAIVDKRQFKDLAMSNDGSTIAFVSTGYLPYQGSRVMWLDLNHPNAKPQQLLQSAPGSEISIAGWTRRGTVVTVIFPDQQSGKKSQIIELGANGPVRPALEDPSLLGFTARLDAARDRVFITTVDEGVATIAIVALNGGQRRTLVGNSIEGITFGGYAVAADGGLVFMRKEVNHNVWLFRVQQTTPR